jgi:hypothetical protein
MKIADFKVCLLLLWVVPVYADVLTDGSLTSAVKYNTSGAMIIPESWGA